MTPESEEIPLENTHRFQVRPAVEADAPLILEFILELAAYEKMTQLVTATVEDVRSTLFAEKQAEVLIGEEAGSPVAFALYFHNYSTFHARRGLFLEDLFVRDSCRGRGYGKKMMAALARIALERDCRRFEWNCLDWNQPSIDFYRKLGAVPLDTWTTYRLDRAGMEALCQ